MSNQVIENSINPSAATQVTPNPEKKKIDFGNGKYSAVAESIFNASQYFLGVNETQAEKIAKAYASDLGRLNMSVDAVNVGKPTSDGYVTIRESGVVKKIKCTNSMRISAIIRQCNALYKLGAMVKKVVLDEELTEWLK